jgi:hypothetical protein
LLPKPSPSRGSSFMDLISIAIAMVFFVVMAGVIWALDRV